MSSAEGIEYVVAVYGLVLATLVLWMWIISRRFATHRRSQAGVREAQGRDAG